MRKLNKPVYLLIIITAFLATVKLLLIFFWPADAKIPYYSDLTKPTISQTGKITVPILAYHHIRRTRAGDYNSVSPEIFEAQMKWLKDNGYEVISYSRFYQYLTSSSTPLRKSVVLSFDDGYKDQYLNALPVLKKYGYSAIFFVNYETIYSWWRWGYMNSEMLKDLLKNGMEIGSHGLEHKDLTKLALEKAIYEIRRGKLNLEYSLGEPIEYLAYPNGVYSPGIITRVRQAGFWSAATDGGGAVHDRADGPFAVSRIGVENNLESFTKIVQQ